MLGSREMGGLLQGEGAGAEGTRGPTESTGLWRWSQPCRLAGALLQAQLSQPPSVFTAGAGKTPLNISSPQTLDRVPSESGLRVGCSEWGAQP